MSDNEDDKTAQGSAGDAEILEAPESLIPYDQWIMDGLRRVIYFSLWEVAERGLPGEHHFFIGFKTQHPAVQISPSLIARFPDEMRIVLQNQFSDLFVDEQEFSVTLQFGGVPETLVIPYVAITTFSDPSVDFSLDFDVDIEEEQAKLDKDKGGPRLVKTEGNVTTIAGKNAGADTQESLKPAAQSAPGSSDTQKTGDENQAEPASPKVVTLDAFRQKKQED